MSCRPCLAQSSCSVSMSTIGWHQCPRASVRSALRGLAYKVLSADWVAYTQIIMGGPRRFPAKTTT